MTSSLFVRLAIADESGLINSHRSASREEALSYRGSLQPSDDSALPLSYVAGYGNTVMASLVVSIDSDKKAHINHVYVVPEAREVGLADSLMQHVLEELRLRKVDYVSAQALPGDRAMKNLFERHGLIAQTIIVGKSL